MTDIDGDGDLQYRTVTCNVWRLSVSGYNEEGQKLCGSSRNKKEDVERRDQRKSVHIDKGKKKKKGEWRGQREKGKKKDGTPKKRKGN